MWRRGHSRGGKENGKEPLGHLPDNKVDGDFALCYWSQYPVSSPIIPSTYMQILLRAHKKCRPIKQKTRRGTFFSQTGHKNETVGM